MSHAALLLPALLLDALLGEPRAIWSRIPHPAVLMGRAVGFLDRALNRGKWRHMRGSVLILLLAGSAGAFGWIVGRLPAAPVLEVLVAAVLLAQRSLADHVGDVSRALRRSLDDGRASVAHIVGRDTSALDEAGVARSAIESAAENLSDGVIAPAFWFAVGGLPAMLVYKAVNTADSMIGYRTARHEQFGWAAARLDDVLNWLPARLTALLILAAGGWPRGALHKVGRDAPQHRSPNAGWPEAAMAGVLGVSLAGPRSYGGTRREFPYVHPEGHAPEAGDIEAAVAVLWRAWIAAVTLAGLVALIAVA